MLLVSEARSFEYGYFKKKSIAQASDKTGRVDTVPRYSRISRHRWHISAFIGFSQRLGANPPGFPSNINNYLDQLKSGYALGGQLSYSISGLCQLGVLYDRFNSSYRDAALPVPTQGGGVANFSVRNDISIEYVGIVLTTRFPVGRQGAFLIDASVGWLDYQDYSIEGTTSYLLEGLTVVTDSDLATKASSIPI